MQQFQWNDKSVEDFIRYHFGQFEPLQTSMEQFKSSKSPKKEWEIVAVKSEKFNNEIRQLPEGAYFDGGYDDLSRGWTIHSVRRLSDGEVFSVGDRIKTETYSNCVIEGFSISKNTLFVTWGNVDYFNKISKLRAAILTTVDGKEIFEGDEFWVICNLQVNSFSRNVAKPSDKNHWKKALLFSTREAAEEYIFENRPVLSLKDVKEAWNKGRSFVGTDWLVTELTTLVKQKLNS